MVLLGFIMIAMAYGMCAEWVRRRARALRFRGRTELTMRELFDAHFFESEVPFSVFERHWLEIARLMRLPAGVLRPSDRFDVELAPAWTGIVSDELEELAEYVHEHLLDSASADSRRRMAGVTTLGELIHLLVRASKTS